MKSPYKIIEAFFAKERSASCLNRVIDFMVYAISFSVFPFELVFFKTPWQDTCFGLIQSDWEVASLHLEGKGMRVRKNGEKS